VGFTLTLQIAPTTIVVGRDGLDKNADTTTSGVCPSIYRRSFRVRMHRVHVSEPQVDHTRSRP
jgi:hypothetical protein